MMGKYQVRFGGGPTEKACISRASPAAYPRALTQAVNKSSYTDREEYLKTKFPSCESRFLALAATNEDAFDAAVSALVIARHIESVVKLNRPADALARFEGLIWYPIQDV